MKICVLVLLVILFGLIGYFSKSKYIFQHDILLYLKEFANYYYLNINIFRNDLNIIIDNFLIMHNNKNAKFNKIFLKNNKIYSINLKIIEIYINNPSVKSISITYMHNIGKNKTQTEIKNAEKFINYLNDNIIITEKEIKNKGDLLFKIWLSIGICLAVVLW